MRGWQRADSLAAAAGGLGLLLILAVASSAFLRGDDWVLLAQVSSSGFGPADVLQPYGNHFMPFGLTVFWAARAAFGPTPWWPLVGLGLALAAVALLYTWRSIRLLVGPVPRAVLPFLLAALGSPALAAVAWPSAMVTHTPYWAATAIATYLYVRTYVTERRHTVAILTTVALALLAVESAVLILPLLFLIGCCWFSTGGVRDSVRAVWRRDRTLWLGGLAVAAVYLGVYIAAGTYVNSLPGQSAQADTVVEGMLQVFGKVLPTLLVAGPWSWNSGIAPGIDPPTAVAIAVGLCAWLAVWRLHSRWRLWWPLFAWLAVTVLLLSAGRIAAFGTSVLLNPYYYATSATLLSLTIALAWVRSPARAGLTMAVAALLTVSAIASHLGYARAVASSPSWEYLTAARESLREPTLITSAPRQVFDVYLRTPPFDTSDHLLGLAGVQGQWLTSAESPMMLGPTGARVPLTIDQPVLAQLTSYCVPLDAAPALALPAAREPFWPTYRATYTAAADTVAEVSAGDTRMQVPLRAGQHTVYFTADARSTTLTIKAAGTCLSNLAVGPAVPAG